mgnify:CR=1 FL=1
MCGAGLIPAHAGKTWPWPQARPPCGAHPRSRGENFPDGPGRERAPGSSPLTRGKPTEEDPRPYVLGLIPAHAGKTITSMELEIKGGAHPRSRGENGEIGGGLGAHQGSSPLTRGKHLQAAVRLLEGRLIPAHAGKTYTERTKTHAYRAHPRSRGENKVIGQGYSGAWGSSPLTRGKPERRGDHAAQEGLIPAHAGKTRWKQRILQVWEAHPRSRGENTSPMSDLQTRDGSSPLTRGKLEVGLLGGGSLGLIPAHAGKTRLPWALAGPPQAHPRSRGENPPRLSPARQVPGSSPLTRGKPRADENIRLGYGLIPAHAGKTPPRRATKRGRRAHPRSRGENPPIARSDPTPPWLIPAHAGKTARGRVGVNMTGAHPRSRGENIARDIPSGKTAGSSPLTRGKRCSTPWQA